MTEGSSISSSYAGINADDDVYEPSEILVHHIGENDAVCSGGEGGSSCEEPTAPTILYPPPTMQQPMETPESMPSVERRRRRRQTKNTLYNDYNVDNDFMPITSRRGWRGDAWIKYDTAILGILLFLAIRLLSLRDKIMLDIRRSRQDALTNDRPILFLPRYIRQIPPIATILLKNLLNGDILQQLKRFITNPLQSPQILFELLISTWDIIGDFLQQLQYFLRSLPILRILFGAGVIIIGDEVVSDVVPELEEKGNNDVGADHDNDEANAANGHAAIQATKAGLKSKSVVREIRYDINDLPPAFENEEDYPPGWLMYHPKHGVRTREFLMELEGRKLK
jgi:hypothetical protein